MDRSYVHRTRRKAPPLSPAQQERAAGNVALVKYVMGRMGHRVDYLDPDDALQEGCVALCKAARTYDPARGAWSTHACRAIFQGVGRALPKRGRHVQAGPDLLDAVPDRPGADPDDGEAVRAALSRLRAADRALLAAVYYDGLGLSEVARRLGFSPQAVAQRHRNALSRLAKELRRA